MRTLISLTTLCALAAALTLTLAPAQAMAMVDSPSGRLAPMTQMAWMGWNGSLLRSTWEWGAGGAAPIPGTGRPGEVIEITDSADEPFEPCREMDLCLPGEGHPKLPPPLRDQQNRDGPRPGGNRPTEVSSKAPPKQTSDQEKEGRCRAILGNLDSKRSKEIPELWVDIQELDPSLADEPYPLLVKAEYLKVRKLVGQWGALGCGPLLGGKKLPPVYSRIPV